MKHRAHTLTIVGTGILMAFVWGACGGPQDGPEEANGHLAASPANTVGSWGGVQPTAYPTAASTPYAPPPVAPLPPPPPPPTEQECRTRASRPAPYDVNGMTDVKGQFGVFFNANHETFRCCFDALEAPSRPNVNVQVSLIFRVDRDGKLTSVAFGPGSASIFSQTAKCITDVAGMLSYPVPIGGKSVAFNRVFDFKAHR